MVKGLLDSFIKKRQIKPSLELKKIRKKGNESYVKCNGFENSFNNRIDKKDIVI